MLSNKNFKKNKKTNKLVKLIKRNMFAGLSESFKKKTEWVKSDQKEITDEVHKKELPLWKNLNTQEKDSDHKNNNLQQTVNIDHSQETTNLSVPVPVQGESDLDLLEKSFSSKDTTIVDISLESFLNNQDISNSIISDIMEEFDIDETTTTTREKVEKIISEKSNISDKHQEIDKEVNKSIDLRKKDLFQRLNWKSTVALPLAVIGLTYLYKNGFTLGSLISDGSSSKIPEVKTSTSITETLVEEKIFNFVFRTTKTIVSKKITAQEND